MPQKTAARRPPRHAWGRDRRIAFIEFRLLWEGRINRKDLQGFFGISTPQASTDLKEYRAIQGAGIRYDETAKAYVPTDKFAPQRVPEDSDSYLYELLARWSEFTDEHSSFVAWVPPLGILPLPQRKVAPKHLVEVLTAIRSGNAIDLHYQSTSRPEALWRPVSPHALAWDGLRWHVRAYCHTRERFSDFVLGRILGTRNATVEPATPSDDHLWHQSVSVRLGPNSGMDEGARHAIELDYNMAHGEITIELRGALLFYLFQRLGLPGSGWEAPAGVQQLELRNEEELREIMGTNYPGR